MVQLQLTLPAYGVWGMGLAPPHYHLPLCLCACLAAAGSAVFHRLAKHFDVVIIDEAAQAVEPSVMVPLVMGCKQVGLGLTQQGQGSSPTKPPPDAYQGLPVSCGLQHKAGNSACANGQPTHPCGSMLVGYKPVLPVHQAGVSAAC